MAATSLAPAGWARAHPPPAVGDQVARPTGESSGDPKIAPLEVAEGFHDPIDVGPAHDGSGRLFVVERAARTEIANRGGSVEKEPFVDLAWGDPLGGIVRTRFVQEGVSAISFRPNFENNGRIQPNCASPLFDEAHRRVTSSGSAGISRRRSARPHTSQSMIPTIRSTLTRSRARAPSRARRSSASWRSSTSTKRASRREPCRSRHRSDGGGPIRPSLVDDHDTCPRARTDKAGIEVVYGGAAGAPRSSSDLVFVPSSCRGGSSAGFFSFAGRPIAVGGFRHWYCSRR
mgnify:CR=1 FL=1